MLRSLVLLVACQPAAVQAVRMVKKAKKPESSVSETMGQDESDQGLAANVSLAEQGTAAWINPSVFTQAWKDCHHCNAQELQTVMYYNIAKMDRKKPIGQQIVGLVKMGLSITLTMVNPLLGLAFSVFAGMLGMGGADPKEELIKKILEKVDKMISKELSSFVRQWNQAHMASIVNNIQYATTSSDWSSISHQFNVPQVFNMSCYTKQKETCEDFRTKFGAGEALVAEIEYTHLMINSWLEMLRAAEATGLTVEQCRNNHHNRFCDDLETYVSRAAAMEPKIREAANLLVGHLDSWEKYRMKDEKFHVGTVHYIKTRPGGPCGSGKQRFVIKQGYDEVLKGEFAGNGCSESRTYCERPSMLNRVKAQLQTCRDKWIDASQEEIRFMREEVDAIRAVVASF